MAQRLRLRLDFFAPEDFARLVLERLLLERLLLERDDFGGSSELDELVDLLELPERRLLLLLRDRLLLLLVVPL